jgi:LysR family glycine cleavage system transcriptional activator
MALSIPSLSQLRCFELAARKESFTGAADVLCLTPSAVSHQIRSLEASLGVDLFVRLGQKMHLSEQGRRFLDDIQPAFALIEAGIGRLKTAPPRDVLTILVAASFAEMWLMPNLTRFMALHPAIEIRLVTLAAASEYDVDCEIRYGHGKWMGLTVEKIADDRVIPLISSDLFRRGGGVEAAGSLMRYPLIYTESRQQNWDQWFRSQGLASPDAPVRLRVDRSPLAIKAAVCGLGVALESRILAAREIKDGLLIPLDRLIKINHTVAATYFLVSSHTRGTSNRVNAFTDWLRTELAETLAVDAADEQVGSCSPRRSATKLTVNAGAKVHRRAGVRMHYG